MATLDGTAGLQLRPKGPFSGSELSFALALPEGAAAAERAWDIAGAAQDALEPLITVAAPVAIQLRVKGFNEQASSQHTDSMQTYAVQVRDFGQLYMSCFGSPLVEEHALLNDPEQSSYVDTLCMKPVVHPFPLIYLLTMASCKVLFPG